ncbi:hypothetical protein [Candidatus Nitrotoga sp. 1052]|uniref:hypothetical protein n=1 Tax=Candidatus Nitrotoga sp. 1052 TaxID=2886964 RepID=UPI001EF5490B|nr:hypothetical protein [Candidatus Nitrotoga sp. 1052]CAH1081251.1 conserved hypothetical protein [Candidatus Nitrotoga sp. 1052]
MKRAYMINGVGGRCLTFVTVLSLCACSVLQIDVDEYKGPMANHEDIQLRQYVALAISAKPLIVALRNNYISDDESYASYIKGAKKHDEDCLNQNAGADIDDYIKCTFKLDIAYFLNSILALYENTKDLNDKIEDHNKKMEGLNKNITNHQPAPNLAELPFTRKQKPDLPAEDQARDKLGITALTKKFIDATEKVNNHQDERTLNTLRVAKERLNDALIIFAEKILYTVNNHQLANGSPGKESFARKLAVLQSLGNTLVVHADDLRKRAAHDQHLKDRKDSELAASRLAFAPGAQNAFDNLARDLGAAIQKKINKEESLQSAINTFSEMHITEESISELKKKLINDAQEKQPKLDTYRTVFNDYNFKFEGNILADGSVADDRSSIASLIGQSNSTVTTGDVLNKLNSWLKDKIKTPPTPPTPEHNRRVNTKAYLEKLHAADFGIANGTEKEVFKKLDEKILTGLNVDNVNLEERQRKIADNLQALNINKKNTEELPAVRSAKNKLETARETIGSLKQVVLQQAETANVVDLSGLRHLLLLELKEQGESEKDHVKKDNFLTAGDVLTAMSIPKTFQFSGGSQVKTQRDVLDDVIAQLQQQRLEVASRGGDITALNKALDLAYEQRGGLAYLRPASAYLRNAFSNTSVQDNSGSTNCRNLLFSLFCDDGGNRAFRETKLEIDKQFWQTINTIKVRGGGATDFAIVKDDVGNWYVKGLSSDPESIIKSAQSLALFNMGGKVNLNLLGQVETRRKLAKLDIGDSNRKILKDELREQQSGSGANTAGLEKVLAKYRKEYVDSTTTDVNGLIGKLDQLPTDITAAWQDINFGETKEARLKILKDLLGTPAELATAQKALEAAKADLAKAAEPAAQASNTATAIALASTQKEATADPAKAAAPASSTAKVDIETAKANASNAIVKSLIEVRNMRSRLVKAIIQDDEFIEAQRSAYEVAKTTFDVQVGTVADKKKDWEKANVDVTNKQTLLDAMTVPAKIDEQQKILTAAKETLKKAQEALDTARSEHDTAVRGAHENLSSVFKRKQNAQVKVDVLIAKPQDAERDKLLDIAKAALAVEETALVAAEKELAEISIPSKAVTDTIKARDNAKTDLAVQEGIFNHLTASSAIEGARTDLTTAKGKLTTAKAAWELADSDLIKLRTSAKGAEDAYTLAKSNRIAAARKVTILADSLIEVTTANRLEAVKAYEVAIGFVGQTAGGQ